MGGCCGVGWARCVLASWVAAPCALLQALPLHCGLSSRSVRPRRPRPPRLHSLCPPPACLPAPCAAYGAGTVHAKAIAPVHLRSTCQSLFFCLFYGLPAGISGLAGGLIYERLGMRWAPAAGTPASLGGHMPGSLSLAGNSPCAHSPWPPPISPCLPR